MAKHLYYASDYFEQLYQPAEKLIEAGHAYIDPQDADTIRAQRGQLHEAGQNSPYRDRPTSESLDLFRRMRANSRRRTCAACENRHGRSFIVMRDPVIYRIRATYTTIAPATRGASTRCTTFTHCISDALKNITHSLCTLEFENNRPLYNCAGASGRGRRVCATAARANRIRPTEPDLRHHQQTQTAATG